MSTIKIVAVVILVIIALWLNPMAGIAGVIAGAMFLHWQAE